MKFHLNKAMRAVGYGILTALGSGIAGLDVPGVAEGWEHGLVGVATALIVYSGPRYTSIEPVPLRQFSADQE